MKPKIILQPDAPSGASSRVKAMAYMKPIAYMLGQGVITPEQQQDIIRRIMEMPDVTPQEVTALMCEYEIAEGKEAIFATVMRTIMTM